MSLTLEAPPLPLSRDAEGTVRVAGTRVTLETVVVAFKNGSTAEQIVQDYPILSLADVYAVVHYYLRRRSDVDEYLADQQSESEQLRSTLQERCNTQDIRERLAARRPLLEQDNGPTDEI